MQYLLDLISGFTQQEIDQRLIFVVLVAAAVFALGVSATLLYTALVDPARRRLSQLASEVQPSHRISLVDRESGLEKYLDGVSKYIFPQNSAESSRVQAKLIHAGFQQAGAIKTFYAIKTLLALALGLSALLMTQWFPALSSMHIWLLTSAAAFIGLTAPNMVLNRLAERRIRRIRNGFPDALDLFVVCVESGLGFNATILRVAKELEVSHEELAKELDLVATQMRLGIERSTALKSLATRTGLEEISGLVTLIDQSARFGTSIAETLRVYSEEFRDRRAQKAEEAAAKIGTKMIFPMVFCIWPAFFVVAIGPAVMMLIDAFSKMQH